MRSRRLFLTRLPVSDSPEPDLEDEETAESSEATEEEEEEEEDDKEEERDEWYPYPNRTTYDFIEMAKNAKLSAWQMLCVVEYITCRINLEELDDRILDTGDGYD